MLLTIDYRAPEAGDLGYLLHKHPDRVQSFDLAVGRALCYYPVREPDRHLAALLLEVDPALVRRRRLGGSDASLAEYVNDRPYAASSMMAVAIGGVLRSAMQGRCEARPALAEAALPLELTLHAVPSEGGAALAERLFAPLGATVTATPVPLDPERPDWGESRYLTLRLQGRFRLAEALRLLYVLLPVLDDAKHYWVGDDEVGKLLRAGEGWLAEHPERELITRRYLAHQRGMVADALARLREAEGLPGDDDAQAEPMVRPSLQRLRVETVLGVLRELGARSVADLGCGEGALLQRLQADPSVRRIIGTDVAPTVLERAAKRLRLAERDDAERVRTTLHQSSLGYLDDRLQGLDAAVLMEVIEHIDPDRLAAVEQAVFGHAAPGAVVVTTPNAEYNVRYPALAAGAMRHPDHRFEFTRAEFAAWADGVAERYGYRVDLRPVGDPDPALGPATQLALFRRGAAA